MRLNNIIYSKFWLPILVSAIVTMTTVVFEAIKEFFYQGVLTSWQSHAMTIAYSAVISGLVAWYFGGKLRLILERLKEADVIHEREKTHKATMSASFHYLNNLMNNISLVNAELETTGTIDKELLKEVNLSISKMSKELRELGNIDNATRENIDKFIQSRL